MDKNNTEVTEKSISERLSVLWRQLSHNQRRFVVVAQEYASKKDAAEAIGLEPDTVYRWPKIVDEAVEAFSESIKDAAEAMLAEAAAKAAAVKIAGLDSDNEKIRQDVAAEILDRVLGKAMQRNEVSGPDGGPVETKANHVIDADTAGTIFDILAQVGAISTGADDAKDDELHTAQPGT